MRSISITVVMLLLATWNSCSHMSSNSPKQYSVEDFYKTYRMWGTSFSHDEKSILLTSNKSGIYNVYQQAVDGSKRTPLTASNGDANFGRSWFPKDNRFLYQADSGGNEKNHVYVKNIDGSVLDLTPGKSLRAQFIGFSRDNKSFYITTNERDPKFMDLFKYSVKDYERKLIFKNTKGWAINTLSPNGKWLALSKVNSNADNNLYVVDVTRKRKQVIHITKHKGDVKYSAYDFSADSDYLVYGTNNSSEFYEAWKYDLKSKKHSLIHKENWDVSYVYHSKNGQYRVIIVNENAQSKILIKDLKLGKDVLLGDLPKGNIGNILFSRSEKLMLFSVRGDRTPGSLYIMTLADKKYRELGSMLNPDIDINDLVEGKTIKYKSFDGLEIPAILYKPKVATSDNKVPSIVFVHGGPGGQSRKGYSALFQFLVNRGYAIIAVNNRGSSGYGKTFNHMDDRRHGDVDLKDCIWAKKYLESMDWVNGKKVAIMGGSYGGYMVLAALAFSPTTFDLGIDIFGVANWFRTLEQIPSWWESFRKSLYAEVGDPVKDKVRLRKYSPLFHAKNIVRPLLVVQGKNDPRVHVEESSEIVAAVKKNGNAVEYILFEDEGHGFNKKKNKITALKGYYKFLEENL